MTNSKEKISVQVPQPMKTWLEELKGDDYNSLSEVVRDILRKYKKGELVEKSVVFEQTINEIKELLNGKQQV